jgi:thiamine monophosphate synthase
VIEAGADGIAVTSAILAAQHPKIAAAELRSALSN